MSLCVQDSYNSAGKEGAVYDRGCAKTSVTVVWSHGHAEASKS
jgi:hypothetical protein